jgi:hypothetical protein
MSACDEAGEPKAFIALSSGRNLTDKNGPCGRPGRQFSALEAEKE